VGGETLTSVTVRGVPSGAATTMSLMSIVERSIATLST
jgi:hypothetical protein